MPDQRHQVPKLRMSGGNGKWSTDQCFQNHVNIDITTSIISVSTSAYVPVFLPYGVKMNPLFFIYVKPFLKKY